MKTNLYLWSKIKKLNIDFFMKIELFEVIEKYIDQVHFVTGVISNECTLFLAERESNFERTTYLWEPTNEKETNFLHLMKKVRSYLSSGFKLNILIGFKSEAENQLEYFPDWYKENCSEGEAKIFEKDDEKIDHLFNHVLYSIEQDKKNKKINQLLMKAESLTKDEKLMLMDLSNQYREKALV